MSESTPAAAAPSPDASTSSASTDAKPAKVMPKGSSTSLLFTIAVVLSSLVVALPVTVSQVVEGVLDTSNPDHVADLANGYAYLSQILGTTFAVLGVLLIAIIVVYVLIYRRERTLDTLRLPLTIIALQIVLGVVAIIFTQFTR